MRLDWENDGRLWFTKGMPLDQKEGQLVVLFRRTCEFECVSPRREEPFDTLTAAQEWCEANDPAKSVDSMAGHMPGDSVEADPLLVEAKRLMLKFPFDQTAYYHWPLLAFVKLFIARFEAGTMPKEAEHHTDEEFQKVTKERDGWHASNLKARRELETLRAAIENDFWIHMGDGTDHPESLTCRVVMTADQYRELMARPVISDSVKPKEVASPAVQPQFVKGQTVVCVDNLGAGDWLLNNQRYVIDGVFGNFVYFDKTPWHARRFRALTAEEHLVEVKPQETLQPFKIWDVVKWKESGIARRTVTDIGCREREGMIRVDDVSTWTAADDWEFADTLKTEETKAKPKFCVCQKVRVIPGMGSGNMLVDESEHVCSAVHDGRIEIDDIRMQWDDRCFEVVEETVIVPWESLAEVPLDAWFSQGSAAWERISEIYHGGRGYVNIGERICSMKDLFNDGWLYTLDPRQDPPVVHRCGKPMQKG